LAEKHAHQRTADVLSREVPTLLSACNSRCKQSIGFIERVDVAEVGSGSSGARAGSCSSMYIWIREVMKDERVF
jgi:hypothetical protein